MQVHQNKEVFIQENIFELEVTISEFTLWSVEGKKKRRFDIIMKINIQWLHQNSEVVWC